MTNIGSGSGFMIEPEAIHSLQKAFQQASDLLQKAVASAQNAHMAQAAMGDDPSKAFQQAFNSAVQRQSSQLTAFQQRLQQVMQQLGEIQRTYDQHEHSTAQNMTSKLGS
jgi:uncharacterized protein YukE